MFLLYMLSESLLHVYFLQQLPHWFWHVPFQPVSEAHILFPVPLFFLKDTLLPGVGWHLHAILLLVANSSSQLHKMYQSRGMAKNSWWWAERLPKTCRVVIPIKLEFGASVGFILKESVTMHAHTIVKILISIYASIKMFSHNISLLALATRLDPRWLEI